MAKQLWSHTLPGIYIDGDATFFTDASNDLTTLYSRPIGKELITTISKRTQGIGTRVGVDKHLVIMKAAGVNDTSQAANDANAELRAPASVGSIVKLAGGGSGCLATYRPSENYTLALGLNTPAYVALGHEMIHGLHGLSGDVRGNYDTSDNSNDANWKHEEARTVGISIYAKTRISENALRREHNLPLRNDYSGDDFSSLTSIT